MTHTPNLAQTVKAQATRLSDYFRTHGIVVSRSQALEGISRSVHGKPWNVVQALCLPGAAKVAGRADAETGVPLVLLPGAASPAPQQLRDITQEGRYYVDVVLQVDFSDLMQGIEAADDVVAERITGSVADLQDISFEAPPKELDLPQPDSGHFWMRVVADWDPQDGYDDEPSA